MQNLIDAVCSESSHHIIHNYLLSKSNEMFWLYSFPSGKKYFASCKSFIKRFFMHLTITQKDNCGLESLKYVNWGGLLYLLELSTLQINASWRTRRFWYISVYLHSIIDPSRAVLHNLTVLILHCEVLGNRDGCCVLP